MTLPEKKGEAKGGDGNDEQAFRRPQNGKDNKDVKVNKTPQQRHYEARGQRFSHGDR
jgi:hypothetical protein